MKTAKVAAISNKELQIILYLINIPVTEVIIRLIRSPQMVFMFYSIVF